MNQCHKCDGIMSIMDDCEKSMMKLIKFAYGFGERDEKNYKVTQTRSIAMQHIS